MSHSKELVIRARFVRRFSDLRLFEIKLIRVGAWRKVTPDYSEREAMTIGRVPATREARRYWKAYRTDHANG